MQYPKVVLGALWGEEQKINVVNKNLGLQF